MIDTLLIISKFTYLFSATITIGLLLNLVFFLKNENGRVLNEYASIKKRAAISALVWALSSFVFIVATLASILDLSLTKTIDFTTLKSFVTQISLGKFLALQAAGAFLVAIVVRNLNRVTQFVLTLLLAIAALSAPIFQSHASSGGSHLMAIGTLMVHVIALAMWVGGLIAILITVEIDQATREIALKRFSQMAFWTAIAVVISGTVNAWIRMNFSGAWQGTYGLLLAQKILLTVLVLALAAITRRKLSGKISKLILLETSLLISIVFIGTVLSQSNPPLRQGVVDPIEALVGLRLPAELSLNTWLFEFQPDALTVATLIFISLLYFKGVRILHRRGDKWPLGRLVSFVLGILIINYAINGAIGVYAHFGFSYHMIEHMILGMIAPIFLVLSAPITLALRTLPQGRDDQEEGPRNILIRFLHSKYAKFITNPVVALMIFDGSLFALYFTGLFGTLMGSHVGHLFMNLHFVLAGVLFFHVIVGIDPNPNRPPNVVRMVILFAAMSIHAFFSIALMSATTLMDGGYYTSIGNPLQLNLLEDQYKGGAIGWAMGEIPILIALTAAFIQWMREDRKETERIDRKAARASAMGESDDLAKYNQYLAELARGQDKKSN